MEASWSLFIVALLGAEPRGHTALSALHSPRYLRETTQDTLEIPVSHKGPPLVRQPGCPTRVDLCPRAYRCEEAHHILTT